MDEAAEAEAPPNADEAEISAAAEAGEALA
jgi:hypothetical protein